MASSTDIFNVMQTIIRDSKGNWVYRIDTDYYWDGFGEDRYPYVTREFDYRGNDGSYYKEGKEVRCECSICCEDATWAHIQMVERASRRGPC